MSIDHLFIKSQAFYKVWNKLNDNNIVMPGKIIELKNYSEDLPIHIKQ